MSGRHLPSLDIFHNVVNVDREDVAGLSRALIGDESDYVSDRRREEVQERSEAVRKLLRPARLLRAETIVHSELLRLHQYAGINDPGEEHIDELSAYMDEVLSGTWPDHIVDTPMLPLKLKKLGRSGLVLSVAGSPLMLQERALAKGAMAEFYRLRSIPDGIWLNDDQVTRPWLARAVGPEASNLIRELETTLQEAPDLLPEKAEFGGVRLEPNPHR
ncbi:MAG TPA: hypothetical protein VFX84_00640 [Candidatus Saccharimonadales bacterium]|nr:hypothetical protein [Candidatus Saccharimonadales bacterium]